MPYVCANNMEGVWFLNFSPLFRLIQFGRFLVQATRQKEAQDTKEQTTDRKEGETWTGGGKGEWEGASERARKYEKAHAGIARIRV